MRTSHTTAAELLKHVMEIRSHAALVLSPVVMIAPKDAAQSKYHFWLGRKDS